MRLFISHRQAPSIGVFQGRWFLNPSWAIRSGSHRTKDRALSHAIKRQGDNLAGIRKAHSMSQTAVAGKLGIKSPNITDLETGANRITPAMAVRLAKVFKISPLKILPTAEMKRHLAELQKMKRVLKNPPKTPGQVIWRLMLEKGWKRTQLQKEAGVTLSSLNKIFEGKVFLKWDSILKIARALNVHPAKIYFPDLFFVDLAPFPDDPRVSQGENLSRLRIQRGLSLSQMANLSGVDVSALCRYEKDGRAIPYEQACKMARAFQVHAATLLFPDLSLGGVTKIRRLRPK